MARPAKALEVVRVIGTPISFCNDVVDGRCRGKPALSLALLAQVLISCEYHRPEFVPTGPITSLMPRLSSLVLLPSFIAMSLAVA